jgi:hypothetical protein
VSSLAGASIIAEPLPSPSAASVVAPGELHAATQMIQTCRAPMTRF